MIDCKGEQKASGMVRPIPFHMRGVDYHSRGGGNPGLPVLEQNGFPITTSGMTNRKSYCVSYVKGFPAQYSRRILGQIKVSMTTLVS